MSQIMHEVPFSHGRSHICTLEMSLNVPVVIQHDHFFIFSSVKLLRWSYACVAKVMLSDRAYT